MKTTNVVIVTVAVGTLILSGVAQATGSRTERALFHDIYKELVETNTSHSVGDNTLAAHRLAKRLRDAGFTEAEMQVVEPFPKKGNLILASKGTVHVGHYCCWRTSTWSRPSAKNGILILSRWLRQRVISPHVALSMIRRWPQHLCRSYAAEA